MIASERMRVIRSIQIAGVYAITAGLVDVNIIIAGYYYSLARAAWRDRPHTLYGKPVDYIQTQSPLSRRAINKILARIEYQNTNRPGTHICDREQSCALSMWRTFTIATALFSNAQERSCQYHVVCKVCGDCMVAGYTWTHNV